MKRWPMSFPTMLLLASVSVAAPPTLNYRGQLILNGSPASGSVGLTFRLYDASPGGNLLWTETDNVVVTNGPQHRGEHRIENWDGMYFPVRVVPSGPCPGRQIPPSCVASTTCYPAASLGSEPLGELSTPQWRTLGQPVEVTADHPYSIGFEYRVPEPARLTYGLGRFGVSRLGSKPVEVALPAGHGAWRTFWSAPFSVTREELRGGSSLRLVASTDAMEIRNVRFVSYP